MHTLISLISSVSLRTEEDSLSREIKEDLNKDYEESEPTIVATLGYWRPTVIRTMGSIPETEDYLVMTISWVRTFVKVRRIRHLEIKADSKDTTLVIKDC